MGQRVVGVLYGVNADKHHEAISEDSGDLLGKWAEKKKCWFGQSNYDSRNSIVPDHEFDCGNTLMIGFWVLCEHGEDKGCEDLGESPLPLADIEAPGKTCRAWNAFAKWAEEQGIVFDNPRLWLMTTEVA